MAFSLTRKELNEWKKQVISGEIAIITHYWLDSRFPDATTVTKVGCTNIQKLIDWGKKYDLKPEWIDLKENYTHFDLFGEIQIKVLLNEKQFDQIKRFKIKTHY